MGKITRTDPGPDFHNLPAIPGVGTPSSIPSAKLAALENSYLKYSGVRGVHLNEDIDYQRAVNQGGWTKFGRFLANLVPNTAATLLDMAGQGVNLLTEWDTERDYKNGLTKAGEAIRDWGGTLPIYRQNNDLFDPADPGWWFQMLDGLVSSAAGFAIGGGGVAGALGKLSRSVISELNATARVARSVNLAGKGVSAGILSYAEGAQQATQVYEKVYEEEFYREIRRGTDPELAKQKAVWLASQSAATSTQLNVVLNTGLNMIGLSPFFHGSKIDIADAVLRGAGKNRGLDEMKDALSSLKYNNTDLSKMYKRQGLYSLRNEGFQESLEELNNQFAQRTGEELGAEGKAKGFLEQLGELSRWSNRTMNAEGMLAASMGFVGGVGQTLLIDRLPLRSVKMGDSGILTPMDIEKGAQVKEIKRVSSRVKNELGHAKYFDQVKDALLEDVTWYQKKSQELATAVKEKKPLHQIDALRREMLQPLHGRYVDLGLAPALMQTYKNIENLDAETPIEQKYAEKIAALKESKEPADVQELAELEQYVEANQGKSEAEIHGYALHKGDDSFKEKAREAASLLQQYEQTRQTMENKYKWLEGYEDTPAASYMTHLKMNLLLADKQLTDATQELQKLEEKIKKDYNPQAYDYQEQLKSASMKYLQTAREHSLAAEELERERQELANAQQVYRSTKDLKAFAGIMKKYGIAGADDASIVKGLITAKDDLRKRIDSHRQAAESMESAFHGLEGFEEWSKNNPNQGVEGFLAASEKKYPANMWKAFNELAAKRADLHIFRSAHETAKKNFEAIDGEKGVTTLIKALKAQQLADTERYQLLDAEQEFYKSLQSNMARRMTELQKRMKSKVLESSAKRVLEAQKLVDAAQAEFDTLENPGDLTINNLAQRVRYHKAKHYLELVKEDLRINGEYHDQLLGKVQELEQLEEVDETPLPGESTLIPEQPAPGEVTQDATTDEAVEGKLVWETAFGEDSQKVKLFIDGNLQLIHLTMEAMNLLIDGINSVTSKPVEISEELRNQLIDYIGAVYADVQSAGIMEDVANTFLKTFRPEDAQFLADQSMLLQLGQPLDEEEFTARGLQNMIGMVRENFTPKSLIPQELLDTIDSPMDHIETISKHLHPHMAGALVRSRDRLAFLNNLYTGAPLDVGVKKAPSVGEHNYREKLPGEEGRGFSIDGKGSYVIDPAGPYKMVVTSDGVYLHEDLQFLEGVIETPPVNLGEAFTPVNRSIEQETFELARMSHSDSDKKLDAFAINTNTLDYKEVTIGDTYELVSRSAFLDKRFNRNVLKPNVARPGTRVILEVDDSYEGPQSLDYEQSNSDRKVRFPDSLDETGAIRTNVKTVGDLPIRIKDAETGEVYGYLPRADWVTAKYPGTDDHRNIAGGAENVQYQRDRIMQIRTEMVKQWNMGVRGGIETTIRKKGPGKVILNMDKDNRPKWGRTATMIPSQDVRIGLAINGTVYSAKNVSDDVVGDPTGLKNVPVVLLPAANGQLHFSPLRADKLSETREIPTMVYFMELFLRHQHGLTPTKTETDHIERLKEEIGFDITTATGLRALINQYFTYTQSFNEQALGIDSHENPGADRQQNFLFNITDGGNIMIGISYSGQKARFAKLSETGEMDKFFIEAFIDGVKNRPKNVVFSDGFAGIRGMNDGGELKVPLYSKGKLRLQTYASYNDYVKDFTQTMVYGKHQPWGDGAGYTYVANPVMHLEYPMEELVAPKIKARDPNIEPMADPGGQEEEFDSLEEDGLGELAGLFGSQSSIRTIPGISASIENLKDLRTFTPDAKGTAAAAKKSLERIRVDVVSPQHSPFTHC